MQRANAISDRRRSGAFLWNSENGIYCAMNNMVFDSFKTTGKKKKQCQAVFGENVNIRLAARWDDQLPIFCDRILSFSLIVTSCRVNNVSLSLVVLTSCKNS